MAKLVSFGDHGLQFHSEHFVRSQQLFGLFFLDQITIKARQYPMLRLLLFGVSIG